MDELYDRLISSSFRYLSVRSRSEKEMTDYLEKKIRVIKPDMTELSKDEIVNRVIDRLKELDVINDRKFAELWVANRIRTKKKSNLILKQELKSKGITDETIEEALESEIGEDETERIRMIINKKLKIWSTLPKKEQKIKLYNYIVRHGFRSSLALRTIDEYLKKDYISLY